MNKKNCQEQKKNNDKNKEGVTVAVFYLKAVFQLPKGEVSVFYYKSKLNVQNFTIYDIQKKTCRCYVWDESHGHRGANEISSCILRYLEKICSWF